MNQKSIINQINRLLGVSDHRFLVGGAFKAVCHGLIGVESVSELSAD